MGSDCYRNVCYLLDGSFSWLNKCQHFLQPRWHGSRADGVGRLGTPPPPRLAPIVSMSEVVLWALVSPRSGCPAAAHPILEGGACSIERSSPACREEWPAIITSAVAPDCECRHTWSLQTGLPTVIMANRSCRWPRFWVGES